MFQEWVVGFDSGGGFLFSLMWDAYVSFESRVTPRYFNSFLYSMLFFISSLGLSNLRLVNMTASVFSGLMLSPQEW